MISIHAQKLEKIIEEMESDDEEYQLWIDFLEKIYPDSKLINSPSNSIKTDLLSPLQVYTDVREIMMLAEAQKYPTWFIQPKYSSNVIIEYENGELKTTGINEVALPQAITNFTGKIAGFYDHSSNASKFIAHDLDHSLNFLDKISTLENHGFETTEYVLFPTEKIPTISSSKLETFFQNYISQARERNPLVEGLVIVSDIPLNLAENGANNTRIVYQASD